MIEYESERHLFIDDGMDEEEVDDEAIDEILNKLFSEKIQALRDARDFRKLRSVGISRSVKDKFAGWEHRSSCDEPDEPDCNLPIHLYGSVFGYGMVTFDMAKLRFHVLADRQYHGREPDDFR